jgi:hypothetical protein
LGLLHTGATVAKINCDKRFYQIFFSNMAQHFWF